MTGFHILQIVHVVFGYPHLRHLFGKFRRFKDLGVDLNVVNTFVLLFQVFQDTVYAYGDEHLFVFVNDHFLGSIHCGQTDAVQQTTHDACQTSDGVYCQDSLHACCQEKTNNFLRFL